MTSLDRWNVQLLCKSSWKTPRIKGLRAVFETRFTRSAITNFHFPLFNSGDFMTALKYKKRKTLPGFPKEGKFRTKAEVDAHLSGEKIQCLLCGRWFHIIGGSHLLKIHGITVDDYRSRYGLPWKRGLVGTIFREKLVAQGEKAVADGNFKIPVRGVSYRTKGARKNRPSPPCIRDRQEKWTRRDYEAILGRIRHRRRTLADVCQ